MTMLPMRKTCSKCHRKYDWNPDVGNMLCPYCYGLGKQKKNILNNILGKSSDGMPDEMSKTNEKTKL